MKVDTIDVKRERTLRIDVKRERTLRFFLSVLRGLPAALAHLVATVVLDGTEFSVKVQADVEVQVTLQTELGRHNSQWHADTANATNYQLQNTAELS